jgi:S-DNA-T family DNA segregation ATPase FtsK/SpoIIIE
MWCPGTFAIMATRTSSPTASRSKSSSARTSGKGRSTSRSRSTGNKSGQKPASARKGGRKPARPAPRAVRNGSGPVARLFTALARVLMTG